MVLRYCHCPWLGLYCTLVIRKAFCFFKAQDIFTLLSLCLWHNRPWNKQIPFLLKEIIWPLKNSGCFVFIKSEDLNYFLSYLKLHLILTQKCINELICLPSTHCRVTELDQKYWLFAKTCMLKLFLVSHMKTKIVVGIQSLNFSMICTVSTSR